MDINLFPCSPSFQDVCPVITYYLECFLAQQFLTMQAKRKCYNCRNKCASFHKLRKDLAIVEE